MCLHVLNWERSFKSCFIHCWDSHILLGVTIVVLSSLCNMWSDSLSFVWTWFATSLAHEMLKAQERVWEICLSWLMIRRYSLRVIYCRLILPGELNVNFDRFKSSYSFTVSCCLCSVLSFFVLSKTWSQRIALMATEQWETQNYFAGGHR